MVELIAALIGGVATVAAALVAKQKDGTASGPTPPSGSASLKRILGLFVVGCLAGAILSIVVVEAAKKGLSVGGLRIPVGTIVASMEKTAPEGWLLCDGGAIGADHKDLIRIVGDKTPNLQGKFLRGLDPLGTVVPSEKGRLLGSPQEDEFKKHSHSVGSVFIPGGNFHFDQGPKEVTPNGSRESGEKGGDETRPKNVAVNFIIKY